MEWIEAFPNTCFGFTSLLLEEQSRHELQAVVQTLSIRQILLETDSPYLIPPLYKQEGATFSTPEMIHHVAQKIAALKALPLSVVFEATRSNTRLLYQML